MDTRQTRALGIGIAADDLPSSRIAQHRQRYSAASPRSSVDISRPLETVPSKVVDALVVHGPTICLRAASTSIASATLRRAPVAQWIEQRLLKSRPGVTDAKVAPLVVLARA